MAQKLTIFQGLTRLFGPDGYDKNRPLDSSNKYNIGNEILLKTKDKAEYETAKLQAQQAKYLGQLWRKVDGEMFQQSIHYEVTRIGSYADFESMEFYPEIGAALDIFMEESTTVNNKGKILNIYSESKRVKRVLEDLFFNRLDIHTNLPMWARNLCKYGDNFVYLNTDDKNGIIGCRQMPNFEMERREGDILNSMNTSRDVLTNDNQSNYNRVKFHWKTKNIVFNSWQIAHFRLLGDDRKLPYGTSLLEKARRIWKQLLLSEDAMLIYRVTRAPERRIYKVFVGNIDDKDVEPYINEIANRFKRKPVIDPQTGQMDLRYNQLAQDQDLFIPVRDENAATPIDTLPGASNLSEIADIQYLQRKLFTALRVPKAFLNYEDAYGDGKNLALQDIRFSRTINRIQQALIMELNKIAIIHLYILGFTDELDNFIITLNNPSTQAEMLKIEYLQSKITLYNEVVRDSGNGFAAMSMTRAKRDILGWSDEEIKQDLLEQRMERAAAAELEKTAKIIKHTGIFDKVDKIYGDPNYDPYTDTEEGDIGSTSKKSGGSGFGGGFGGGLGSEIGGAGEKELEFGGEEGEEAAGDEEPEAGLDLGSEEAVSPEEATPTKETIKRAGKILTEKKHILSKKLEYRQKKYQENFLDKLTGSLNKEDHLKDEITKIYDKSIKINEGINNIIGDIDELLKGSD